MSIVANADTRVVIMGGPAGTNAARRMGEFCHLIKKPLNVVAFVFPPDAGKTVEIPYGAQLVSLPVYRTVAEATAAHPEINATVIYVGADRATKAAQDALADEGFNIHVFDRYTPLTDIVDFAIHGKQ